ncbi:hypothetical protein AKJ09_01197 [Labilithrix luteola]|uniref:Uncharacterized protein n=1 Tax=Labilithrix luteola TaxID=1391654 RepID=A0A0K1PLW7_9BACT|nr:hypothetical protein [Labilithrix luteola]AKU94533.1 hypothetical protein AKJ09_01197 [Labilithrix luteola]
MTDAPPVGGITIHSSVVLTGISAKRPRTRFAYMVADSAFAGWLSPLLCVARDGRLHGAVDRGGLGREHGGHLDAIPTALCGQSLFALEP